MNQKSNIVVAASAAAVCACLIWAGTTISAALRESRAAATAAEPTRQTPGAITGPAVTSAAPQSPTTATVPALTYDSFDRAFAGEVAARAERECWSKAPEGSPDALHFRLSVDADGKAKEVTPDLPREEGDEARRAKIAEVRKLTECVASVIRTMKLPIAGPAEARVQANRPRR